MLNFMKMKIMILKRSKLILMLTRGESPPKSTSHTPNIMTNTKRKNSIPSKTKVTTA